MITPRKSWQIINHRTIIDLLESIKNQTTLVLIQISAALIGCLMTRYLDDQATVDAMNGHLREICPTLFSADDAVYAKVSTDILFQ